MRLSPRSPPASRARRARRRVERVERDRRHAPYHPSAIAPAAYVARRTNVIVRRARQSGAAMRRVGAFASAVASTAAAVRATTTTTIMSCVPVARVASASTSRDADAERASVDDSHRARVRLAYRAALKRARRLPDPCARHFARERFAQGFRAHATATSAKEVERRLREVTRWTRRLRRALWNDDDYRAILERAYGVRGRMRHMIRSCDIECREGAPVRTRRATRFELPSTTRETGETYTLRFLFRAFERARERVDEGANDENAVDVDSLERQMRMLRLRVPRYFNPNGEATRATNETQTEEEAKNATSHVRVWPWEAATRDDIAAGEPSYGLGQMGGGANWEMIHLALLKTTFVPLMRERMKTMDRRARRVYERTFDIAPEKLRLSDVPDIDVDEFRLDT